jgi:hypothetical protein
MIENQLRLASHAFVFVLFLSTVGCQHGLELGPKRIDLQAILASTENYAGKTIETEGFLDLSHEGYALYLTAEDLRAEKFEKSAWLELNESIIRPTTLHGKRVKVTGKVNIENKGHLDMWPVALEQVTVTELPAQKP